VPDAPPRQTLARLARQFLDEAEDALVGFLHGVPDVTLGRGWTCVKVLVPPTPAEHYELQLLRGPAGLRVEVGFHAEHRTVEANERALATLVAHERRWRKALGDTPEAAPFLGRTSWRRLSETWDDTVGFDSGVAVDAAHRLSEYVRALEPVRQQAFWHQDHAL
jgi:hypothetical protein